MQTRRIEDFPHKFVVSPEAGQTAIFDSVAFGQAVNPHGIDYNLELTGNRIVFSLAKTNADLRNIRQAVAACGYKLVDFEQFSAAGAS